MTTGLQDRLAAALSGQYEIVRELGSGGMAIVYLANDLMHDREVAIKVLRPELGEALGKARFLREIEIATNLSHPNILPVYDSGSASELLYYVMPCVDGESLRDRMEREGQLPIDESLSITAQVSDALSHAHANGVVHRDIKPANIMLSGETALVADFGIARAVETMGSERLTETGLTVGTPEYMSPEQWGGGAKLDGRSDMYSLGCVAYEMLAGEPPFTGPSVQAVMARTQLESVRSIRVIRPTVSRAIDDVIAKALEKTPADRFADSDSFAKALVEAPTSDSAADRLLSVAPKWVLWLSAVLAVVVLAAGTTLVIKFFGAGSELEDIADMAVFPFMVSGTVDSSVVTPENLAVLLSTGLAGGTEAPVLDPGAVLQVWRREIGSRGEILSLERATELAADIGAGVVIWGQVFGTSDELSLTVSTHRVRDGAELSRVDGVSGSPDSLRTLVERLAAVLLLEQAGAGGSLTGLVARPLSALRPYLAGLQKRGRGLYAEAKDDFSAAISADTTFAEAAVAFMSASSLSEEYQGWYRVASVAWRNRESLSARDSTYLLACLGPNPPNDPTYLQFLARWELMVQYYPDDWEAKLELARLLFHWGPMLGRDLPFDRARRLLDQVLDEDSTLVPAWREMLDLQVLAADSAAVRDIGNRLLAADSTGEYADYVRWRMGTYFGDSALVARVRDEVEDISSAVLERIVGIAQLDGLDLQFALAAAEELKNRAAGQRDLWETSWVARELAINRGHLSDASETIDVRGAHNLPVDELFRVIEAVYWDGDSAAAAAAVRERVSSADSALSSAETPRYAQHMDACLANLWRLAAGQTEGVAGAIQRLESEESAIDRAVTTYVPLCAAVLKAQLAALLGSAEADASLAALDSLGRIAPPTNPYMRLATNMAAARLHEERGDLEAAYAAIRRRPYEPSSFGVAGLTRFLTEEARLATLIGDTTAAIRAYEHYLTLRANPDSALLPEVERIREELRRLVVEPGGR